MNLSDHMDAASREEVAARIVARRDVSMGLTRSALSTQAYLALHRHQWQDAEAILNRIFRIEDPPHLRWMRWTAAAGLENNQEADQFYQQASNNTPIRFDHFLLSVGSLNAVTAKNQGPHNDIKLLL